MTLQKYIQILLNKSSYKNDSHALMHIMYADGCYLVKQR